MNISFTKKQEEYIAEQVASWEYQNNSEVIRDVLRLHQTYRDKVIADLRAEIEKGLDSGVSKRSVKDIIESKRKSGKIALWLTKISSTMFWPMTDSDLDKIFDYTHDMAPNSYSKT